MAGRCAESGLGLGDVNKVRHLLRCTGCAQKKHSLRHLCKNACQLSIFIVKSASVFLIVLISCDACSAIQGARDAFFPALSLAIVPAVVFLMVLRSVGPSFDTKVKLVEELHVV